MEPNTGKVLRGQKRAQVNAHIGDRSVFGLSPPYAKVQDMYLPVFWFENGATMDDHQADLVKDGLTKIHLAHTVRIVAVIAGSVCGSIFIALGFYLIYKFHVLNGWKYFCRDAPDHNDYGTLNAGNM